MRRSRLLMLISLGIVLLIGSLASPAQARGRWRAFSLPQDLDNPWYVATGPDGNLWFTGFAYHGIGRISPSGMGIDFPLAEYDAFPVDITGGPDGNVWFT